MKNILIILIALCMLSCGIWVGREIGWRECIEENNLYNNYKD